MKPRIARFWHDLRRCVTGARRPRLCTIEGKFTTYFIALLCYIWWVCVDMRTVWEVSVHHWWANRTKVLAQSEHYGSLIFCLDLARSRLKTQIITILKSRSRASKVCLTPLYMVAKAPSGRVVRTLLCFLTRTWLWVWKKGMIHSATKKYLLCKRLKASRWPCCIYDATRRYCHIEGSRTISVLSLRRRRSERFPTILE